MLVRLTDTTRYGCDTKLMLKHTNTNFCISLESTEHLKNGIYYLKILENKRACILKKKI